MSELVPVPPGTAATGGGGVLALLTDRQAGSAGERLRLLAAQPAIRRSLPAIAAVGALGGAALLWLALSEPSQRVLYGTLSDAERAEVAASLDTAGIGYTIDNNTGALSVAEDDLYKARMLVASDGALAAPDDTAALLDSIPLGSSRVLEGERVRHARERELTLTIMEIDGVEAVRVHLATPERSVFVREQAAPSASVMVRLARGRSLSTDQARAVGDLVAASVPGLAADAVRIVDQHGKLLSRQAGRADGLELQGAHEDKLRAQIAQLLLPIVGEGNFSSEVQVELDLAEVTRAQEAYDKEGVVRTEAQAQSQQTGAGPAMGVPGVLSNTPPPPATLDPAAPLGTPAATAGATSGESSAQRTFEHGRQVSVSTTAPGGVRRLSVAVALSAAALKQVKPASLRQIEQLVSAAVGANPDRGDRVTVIASAFDPVELEALPFYEATWFPAALRGALALLAVALALLFGVRPLLKSLRKRDGDAVRPDDPPEAAALPAPGAVGTDGASRHDLAENTQLIRTLAAERPDHAAATLRRMLAAPAEKAA